MSVIQRARKKRETGNNLLIIFVTSGVGGILNAIANMQHFDWERMDVGIKIVSILSIVLIAIGIISQRYFHWKADKMWQTNTT